MPANRLRHAAAVILLGLTCACGPGAGEPPDILLISIDTLRADRLSVYGAERETSPALDALAAEGARFANAFAPTSWTLPSHVSLLTGMSIPAHRVVGITDRIDPERVLLAEHLRQQGYEAAAFVSAPFLHPGYGFDPGFSPYASFGAMRKVGDEGLPSDRAHRASHADRPAARVVGEALRWLAGRDPQRSQPLFLFVHLWDPHYDYLPPSPYDETFDAEYAGDLDPRDFAHNPAIHPDMPARDLEHLRALYDGEIRWTDSQVERLLEGLERRGTADRTLVSVVSDHGEEFFEHGRKGHMKTLFDESVRVPWILRYPPRVPPGTVVEKVVSLEDVAPTLLDLAGLPPLPEATGASQAPDLRGEPTRERPALLVLGELVALHGGDWKVLRTAEGELHYYDLVGDPEERAPRPAREASPVAVAALRARLTAARRHGDALGWSGSRSAEVDPDTEEQLRDLGYLEAGDGSAAGDPDASPAAGPPAPEPDR